jgi:hypothetical protein
VRACVRACVRGCVGAWVRCRYDGLALEVTVEALHRGVPLMAKGPRGQLATQDMCVLRHGQIMIATFSRPTAFHERWHFDDYGLRPEDFDLV